MTKLLRFYPWLCSVLLLLSYATLGWIIRADQDRWVDQLLSWNNRWNLGLEQALLTILGYGIVVGLIIILNLVLWIPGPLLNALFGNWLKSDYKAFGSVLFWSFAVVLIICWLDIFVRFLVLTAVSMLARLEFQSSEVGYGEVQTFAWVSSLSILGFLGGYWAFQQVSMG